MATMKDQRAGSRTVSPNKEERQQFEQFMVRNARAERDVIAEAAFRLGLRLGVAREANADHAMRQARMMEP